MCRTRDAPYGVAVHGTINEINRLHQLHIVMYSYPLLSRGMIVQMPLQVGLEDLLKSGVGANSLDKNGRTPLHVAAAQGNLQSCQLLLRYGASGCELDRAGLSPAHRCVELSVSGSPQKRPVFIQILTHILSQSLESLLPEGDNAGESRRVWLTSLLHCAAQSKATQAASVLVKHGARDGHMNDQTQTALHIAAASGDMAIVDLLLNADAAWVTAKVRSSTRPFS